MIIFIYRLYITNREYIYVVQYAKDLTASYIKIY
jgi:hypothetical protein